MGNEAEIFIIAALEGKIMFLPF